MKWKWKRPTWIEAAGLAVGIAGVGVAIVAVVIPLVTDGGNSASGKRDPAHLLVDSFTARDFMQGPHPNAHLEVLLHNTGGTLAVIDDAAIRVKRVFALRRCASQDDIPLSDTYGLVLPHRASPARHELQLHDQVSPDGVDRFAISVSTSLSARDPATYFLFRLEVDLRNDGPESPFPVGTALIALPTVPDQGEYYWTPKTVELLRGFQTEGRTAAEFWGESMPCWRRNTEVLRRALGVPAVRSANLDEISRELIAPSFAKLE
jgi:hypothetical protein